MASNQQAQQPLPIVLDSVLLRMHPAVHSKQYWLWRSERDVVKLDFAYAVMTICRVASSAYAASVPSWCLLLLLVPAVLQLGMITWRRSQYSAARLAIVCWLRITWMCFSIIAFEDVHTLAPAAATAGEDLSGQRQNTTDGAASVAPAAEMAVLFAAVSQLVNLAVQPLLQLIPCVLQLPFQALGVAVLLYNFHTVACSHIEGLPGWAAMLHSLHAIFEGIFHVGTGFVFVTPDVLAGCRPGDLRVVANFCAVYIGLVLPMFFNYKAELIGKACFVLPSVHGLAANGDIDVGGNGNSSSGSQEAPVAVATNSRASAPSIGGSSAGINAERLKLVGPVQPINRDHLLEMMHCPRERVKDDVICCMLLFIITWGMCLWATPQGL